MTMKQALIAKGNSPEEADAIIQDILDDSEDAVDSMDLDGIGEILLDNDLDADFEMEVLTMLGSRF